MTQTLTQLITNLQALLQGTATTFSTDTCTAAIRQAFKQLNMTIPYHAAETQDAVSEQLEYELSDTSSLEIIDVLLEGTDTYHDNNLSLPFDQYFEDDRLFFRLRTPQATSRTLIIRYTKPYTINGLDSETVSTMPALYDSTLLDGAGWIACLVRATGRIETINMNAGVTASFERMADHFRQAFETGLAALGLRRAARSVPLTTGWSDEWDGQASFSTR
jgi:hypothetical protein